MIDAISSILPLSDPVWFTLMWVLGYGYGYVFRMTNRFVKIATS